MTTINATRVALVTGANKGIGKAIVRGLARAGFTVLLGARNAERGIAAAKELANDGTVRFIQLDVTDEASVRAAAEVIEREFGRLDVLVNNAGINKGPNVTGWRPPSEETAENMRAVFETNVFAVVTVTNVFLPLLLRAEAGRIVNVTSRRGSIGEPGAWERTPFMAYSTPKLP